MFLVKVVERHLGVWPGGWTRTVAPHSHVTSCWRSENLIPQTKVLTIFLVVEITFLTVLSLAMEHSQVKVDLFLTLI